MYSQNSAWFDRLANIQVVQLHSTFKADPGCDRGKDAFSHSGRGEPAVCVRQADNQFDYPRPAYACETFKD